MSSCTVLLALAIIGVLPVSAQPEWFTIAGDAGHAAGDYIQLNPAMISKESGLVTIPLRVSRASERTSQDGITFRSFVGVAGVDCNRKTVRYLQASFYKQPNFEGASFLTKEYGAVIRPVAFREIPGDHATRIMRAACTIVGG